MSTSADLAVTTAGARPAPWLTTEPVTPEAGRTAGYAAGYAAGWAQGASAAAERSRAVLEAEVTRLRAAEEGRRAAASAALGALARAAADLERREAPALAELTDALARTGLELAEAVLGAEVLAGGGARAALLRALAPCPPSGAVAVHLHPADVAELTGTADVPPSVRLVPDAGMPRGDAYAEHADGSVDARLAPALERARTALLGGTA